MDIIGITTSSLSGSVSIAIGDKVFTRTFQSSLMNHSSLLIPSNCNFQNCEFVAIDVGPGSFTGIRLAIACAEAVTISSKIKRTAVSSIDIIAENVLARLIRQGRVKCEFIISYNKWQMS